MAAVAVLLAGAACGDPGSDAGRSTRPAIPDPASCPAGTVRVERVFRSVETPGGFAGVNESCERPDGTLHGPTADWHLVERDGRSLLERVYEGQFSNGVEVGVWHQWYAPGRKKSDRHHLTAGVVAHVIWYPDGRLRTVLHYVDGKRHGVELHWDESGRLESVTVYDRGTVVDTSSSQLRPDHPVGGKKRNHHLEK